MITEKDNRYRGLRLYGTRLQDKPPVYSNYHARFNWICNVLRDRIRQGTPEFNTLSVVVRENIRILREIRINKNV